MVSHGLNMFERHYRDHIHRCVSSTWLWYALTLPQETLAEWEVNTHTHIYMYVYIYTCDVYIYIVYIYIYIFKTKHYTQITSTHTVISYHIIPQHIISEHTSILTYHMGLFENRRN